MRVIDIKNDYHVLCNWWRQHEWPAIPKDHLPVTGYIIDNVCAGFLYKTDSKIAWIEFIISNKECDKQLRNDGLNNLITKLTDVAKEDGFTSIFTSVSHPKLIERYSNLNFNVTDKNMSNMIRRV